MKKYQVDDYIGRYRVKKIIGSGSFGTVYEVERKEGKRVYHAAIKVIHISKEDDYGDSYLDDMSSEELSEYFCELVDELIEECAIMENMKGDSHICSYEDHHVEYDESSSTWTIVIRMELLAPFAKAYKTINEFMKEKDVIKLGIDICRALETCEKKNKVIHRDIKPENIFVSNTGNYKLGDFGIAKVLGQRDNTSSKKGTEVYMAPEVFKGLSYDSTVDIYSLGLMLYKLINRNRAPFLPPCPEKITYSDSKQASYMRLNGEANFNNPQDASEELSKIIIKACSYNPQERYQHAQDMRKDLEKIMGTDIDTDYPHKLWQIIYGLKSDYEEKYEGNEETANPNKNIIENDVSNKNTAKTVDDQLQYDDISYVEQYESNGNIKYSDVITHNNDKGEIGKAVANSTWNRSGKKFGIIIGGIVVVSALVGGTVFSVYKHRNKKDQDSWVETVDDVEQKSGEGEVEVDDFFAEETDNGKEELVNINVQEGDDKEADIDLKADRVMLVEGEYLLNDIGEPAVSLDKAISVIDGEDYIDNVVVVDLDVYELEYDLNMAINSGSRISIVGEGYISEGTLTIDVIAAKDADGRDCRDIAEENETATNDSDYILPNSDTVKLSKKDIKKLSLKELNYAKNEIYARRGRRFDSSELRHYFESKSWYKGTIDPDDFSDDMLSEVEKANVILLRNKEFSIDPKGYQLDQ